MERSDRKNKGAAYILLILIASATLFFLAVHAYEKHFNHDYIYENIYIDDISIGGLTRDEAVQKLTDNWQEQENNVRIRLY